MAKTSYGAPSSPTSTIRKQSSNFSTPPSVNLSSWPATEANPYGIYQPASKIVDQGLNAIANPNSAGGRAAQFAEYCELDTLGMPYLRLVISKIRLYQLFPGF